MRIHHKALSSHNENTMLKSRRFSALSNQRILVYKTMFPLYLLNSPQPMARSNAFLRIICLSNPHFKPLFYKTSCSLHQISSDSSPSQHLSASVIKRLGTQQRNMDLAGFLSRAESDDDTFHGWEQSRLSFPGGSPI